MKENRSKMMAWLLVLAVTSALYLAGCTSNQEKGTQESPGTTTATPAQTEASKEPVKLTIMGQDTYNAEYSYAGGKEYPVIQELEKLTNTKIEWHVASPGNNYNTLVDTTLAAGVNLADIIQLKSDASPKQALTLAQQGLIIDLKDLVDQHAPNIRKVYYETLPETAKQTLTEDGKLYWISSPTKNDAIFWNIMYREDWLQKAGITKVPETTDEFYAMLKAFQDKDVNGNGKKDEIFTASDFYGIVYQIAEAFGVQVASGAARDFIVDDGSGKLYNSLLTDDGKRLLQYLNKLYEDGLLDPEIASMTWEKYQSRITQNIVSATNGLWFWPEQIFKGLMPDMPAATYTNLTRLEGPDGKSGVLMAGVGATGARFVISKDSKDPVAAIQFLDFMFTDEARKMRANGIPNVHYTEDADGTIKPTEEFANMMKDNPSARDAIGANQWSTFPSFTIASLDDFLRTNSALNIPALVDTAREILRNNTYHEMRFAAPSLQEMDEIDEIGNEATNYMNEMQAKFIVGEVSFDEWDSFVQQAKALGMDKLLAVRQAMYDRYTGK